MTPFYFQTSLQSASTAQTESQTNVEEHLRKDPPSERIISPFSRSFNLLHFLLFSFVKKYKQVDYQVDQEGIMCSAFCYLLIYNLKIFLTMNNDFDYIINLC